MNIKPQSPYVFLTAEEAKTNVKSAGGILLPDTATDKTPIGIIVANHAEGKLKAGTRVLYNPHEAKIVTIERIKMMVIKESEILAEV